VDSLTSFWDAVVAVGEAIGSVQVIPLAIALGFHFLGLVFRAVAWRNIIKCALHDEPTPLKPVLGGLLAGAGLNGVVPARGGDLLKLFLVHSRLRLSTYPMLASSLVPETLFNFVMGVTLLLWAWQLGVLPSAPELPGISAFELSWAARNPDWAGIIVILVAALIAAIVIIQRPRLEKMWHEVSDGLSVLRRPRVYLREVVTWQAGAWATRVASAWFFLDAFGIEPTLRSALIVIMVQGVSSTLPLTPGGVGPKQALLVVLLAGEAARSTILAFSVGMEVAIVAFQFVLGILAAGLMLDGFHIREAVARARREREEVERMARDPER
jgi:uncharacterized membrane protein YbhN (UPF0104 family)